MDTQKLLKKRDKKHKKDKELKAVVVAAPDIESESEVTPEPTPQISIVADTPKTESEV